MKAITTISNRKTTFEAKDSVLLHLRDQFCFRPPGYFFSPKYQNRQWDGYIRLYRNKKVATGLFLDQLPKLESSGVQFTTKDTRIRPKFRALSSKLGKLLRPYQKDCIDAMVASSNTGGLVVNATGTGKTFIAGAFFARLVGYGLFVVDELTLLEQSRLAIVGLLGESQVGVVGNGVFQPRRITIATIQTLNRNRRNPKFEPWFRKLEAVIVDEIHLALNRQNIDVLEAVQPKAVYGLTATLELQKPHIRMRATAIAGPPIFNYPLAEGVRDKVISQGVFCQVEFPQSGVFESYQREYKALISGNRKRNSYIETLVREGLRRGRRIVVLVERLEHLRILSRRLADLPHKVICGAYSMEDRLKAKNAMDAGTLPLILANRVFAKGVDIRTLDTILDATAGRSANPVTQRYGRGTRMAEGKEGLLYLDIGDCGVAVGKKNRFSACSRNRIRTIKKLGVPVIKCPYSSNAKAIYTQALRKLAAAFRYNLSKGT